MKSRLTDVSIVIVTYEGDGLLGACLESLAKTCGTEPQVIVVDNSPSDETRRLVATFENAHYIPAFGNPGFAGGNNRAIPYCDREYVLLLNNDTVIHTRESIETLVTFLDDHPVCAVAQGTMVVPGEDGKNRLCPCGSLLTPFGFMYARAAFVAREQEPKAYPCFSAIGAFMLFRRAVLKDVGFFLFRAHFWAYYEESDFCHRVWLSGNEVWYVPTSPIDHLCGKTSGRFPPAQIMGRYLRNQLFSLTATLGFWSCLWLVPSQVCVILLHGLLNGLRGNGEMLAADCRAITVLWRDRLRILAARRSLRRIRKASDFAIFRKVMRLPPLSYCLRTLRSNT